MKSLSKLSAAELEEVRALGATVLGAINKERLTDAINETKVESQEQAVQERRQLLHSEGRHGVSDKTPNRRSRESYNTYMKGYMRAYRERSK